MRPVVEAVVEAALWWAGLVGIWLITLSAVTWPEVWVAAGAAMPCAVLARLARGAMEHSWGPDLGWLRGLAALPMAVVADTVRVLLLEPSTSRKQTRKRDLAALPLAGPRRGPRGETRRAASTLLVCATPATLVLDSDPDDHALVVHRLVSGPPDTAKALSR